MTRLFRRRIRQPEEYKDLVTAGPVGKFITLALAIAVKEHATKITYGPPPGIVLSDEDKAKIRADYDQMEREIWTAAELESFDEYTSVQFQRRDGMPVIPCWHEVDGRWTRDDSMPAWCHAYVPQILSDRLVSLDGKWPQEGGSTEWIEYTDFQSDEVRQFVRVKLWFEENNSVTVDLLETRTISNDAPVWWRFRRV
jgi:hypothetical protein